MKSAGPRIMLEHYRDRPGAHWQDYPSYVDGWIDAEKFWATEDRQDYPVLVATADQAIGKIASQLATLTGTIEEKAEIMYQVSVLKNVAFMLADIIRDR